MRDKTPASASIFCRLAGGSQRGVYCCRFVFFTVKSVLGKNNLMANRSFSIDDFLDHVKRASGIPTDYKLAQLLGFTQAAVSAWRRKIALPNVVSVLRLCELSGDDPQLITAQIMAATAKDDDTKRFWFSVFDRLENTRHFDAIDAADAIDFVADD